jgi:hypothetical protein
MTKRQKGKASRPKRKQQSGQPRRTKKVAQSQTNRRSGPRVSMASVSSTAMAICSKINPFCAEAVGAKISDESSNFTTPFQDRNVINLVSDANGFFSYQFQPNFEEYQITGTNSGAGIVTAVTATVSPALTNLTGSYTEFRAVSFGVRLVTTAPWTTATGQLICSVVNQEITGSAGINVYSMLNGVDVSAYAIRDLDLTFIGKPSDHSYMEFQALTSTGSTESTTAVAWTTPLFTGSGLPASSTWGFAEVITNYELRQVAGPLIANQYATRPVPPNHGLTALVDMSRFGLPNFLDSSFAKSVEKIVYNTAIKTVQEASPTLIRPAFNALMM